MNVWSTCEIRWGFRTWHRYIRHHRTFESEKNHELNVIRQMLARMFHRMKYIFFKKWCLKLNEKKKLKRFLCRYKNKKLYISFYTWQTSIEKIVKHRKKMTRILSKVMHQSLHLCLDRWTVYVQQRDFLRHKLILVCSRWRRSTLNFGFVKWLRFNEILKLIKNEEKKKKNRLKQLMSRVIYRTSSLVMQQWMSMVRTRKALRHRMVVSVQRWSIAKQRYGMNTWHKSITELKEKEKEKNRKQNIATKIISRIINRQLALRFDTWIRKLHEKKRLRRFMLRMQHVQLSGWYDAWLLFVDRSKNVKLKITTIIFASKKMKNQQNVLKRYMHWKQWYKIRTSLRSRMLVSVSRWKISMLRYGMSMWLKQMHCLKQTQEGLKQKEKEMYRKINVKCKILEKYWYRSSFMKLRKNHYHTSMQNHTSKHKMYVDQLTTQYHQHALDIKTSLHQFKQSTVMQFISKKIILHNKMKTMQYFNYWKLNTKHITHTSKELKAMQMLYLQRILLEKSKQQNKSKMYAFHRFKMYHLTLKQWDERKRNEFILIAR